jgi:maltooligosyltrehalose trehalohydrolase
MVPMLFQGEEWGSTAPFPFFCDFQGGLADAVRKGRKQEYAWAYEKYGDEVPDPLAPATMQSAVLDWTGRTPEQAARLALVRELLALRGKEIAPRLNGASFGDAAAADSGLLTAHWRMGDGTTLSLTANLSDKDITYSRKAPGAPIWGGMTGDRLPPWSVIWHLGG